MQSAAVPGEYAVRWRTNAARYWPARNVTFAPTAMVEPAGAVVRRTA